MKSKKDEAISTKRALKLALEALEEAWYHVGTFQPTEKAIDLYDEARTALREALAEQPAQQVVDCHATGVCVQSGLRAERPRAFGTLAQQQEPTKAMIDAAERIDWSDSDVRGNIVNMWQAMCAVAPQPAQQEPLQNNPFDCGVYLGSGKDYVIKHHVSYGPAQRTWVGMTDDEIDGIDESTWDEDHQSWGIHKFARAIEAKLREKNT